MPTIRLVVPGEPTAKGRPRATKTGRVYTDAKTRQAENDIGLLWIERRRQCAPAGVPFAVKLTVRFSRPDTHYAKDGSVREGCLDAVPGTPGNRKRGAAKDIDNVAKLVLDALNGVAWDDDVWCTGLMVTKEWTPPHQREGEIDVEVIWADHSE